MRSDRLARFLLRLYPRAWRARYGDEFLAFVEDSGLSWRGVVDVVAAAGVERVRSLAAVMRDEGDPGVVIYSWRDVRDRFAELVTFMALVGLATGALAMAGVPWPSWQWWYQVPMTWQWRGYNPSAPWPERAVASFCSLVATLVLTGIAWLGAQWIARGGIVPTDRWFNVVLGTFLAAGLVRGAYCFYRALSFGSRWQGVSRREFALWRVATFLIVVLLLLAESDPRITWTCAMILWMAFRPPYFLTPVAVAKRRADHERLFGSQGTPPAEDTLSFRLKAEATVTAAA
jgi:hypothetical protein